MISYYIYDLLEWPIIVKGEDLIWGHFQESVFLIYCIYFLEVYRPPEGLLSDYIYNSKEEIGGKNIINLTLADTTSLLLELILVGL